MSETTQRPRALQYVHLSLDDEQVRIIPPAPLGLSPIPMRLVPKSLTDAAAMLCESFYATHSRCIAILLLLDLPTERWSMAVPRQRASADSSCWQGQQSDFPAWTPGMVVIGSVQMRLLMPQETPEDAVPPVDGLHLLVLGGPKVDHRTILCYLRVNGVVRYMPAVVVITDDVSKALDDALPWIEIA